MYADYAFGYVIAITECKHKKKLSEKTKQDTNWGFWTSEMWHCIAVGAVLNIL